MPNSEKECSNEKKTLKQGNKNNNNRKMVNRWVVFIK